jgi:hypothetical protein
MEATMMYQIVNTWNGGKGGREIVFTGTHNECFEWILKNTPFSFHEATTNQGYIVEEAPLTSVNGGNDDEE